MEQLIGRTAEIEILNKALNSNSLEMVSVIGRRRVGKTFLIKTIYKDHITFSITGTQNTPLNEHLSNFIYLLQEEIKSKIPYTFYYDKRICSKASNQDGIIPIFFKH